MDIETLIAESLNLKSQPKAKSFVRPDASKNTASHVENGYSGPTFQPSKKAVPWRDNIDQIHQLFAQIEPTQHKDTSEDDEFGDFQAINNNEPTLDVESDDFGEFICMEVPVNGTQVKPESIPPQEPDLKQGIGTSITTQNTTFAHDVKTPSKLAYQTSQNGHCDVKDKANSSVVNNDNLVNNSKVFVPSKGPQTQWDELSSSSYSDITSVRSLEFMAPYLKTFSSSSAFGIEDKMPAPLPKNHLANVAQDTSLLSMPKLSVSNAISTLTSSNDLSGVITTTISSQSVLQPNYFAIREEIPYPSFDLWVKVLEKCKYHLDTLLSKLKAIDPSAIGLLISSQLFVDYLNDFTEVYAVAHRIKLSFNLLSIQSTSIKLLLDELSSGYSNLSSILNESNPGCTVLNTTYAHSTNSYKFASIESTYCNLCFLRACPEDCDNEDAPENSVQNFKHNFTWKIVEYEGKNYHLSCLNYWLQLMET